MISFISTRLLYTCTIGVLLLLSQSAKTFAFAPFLSPLRAAAKSNSDGILSSSSLESPTSEQQSTTNTSTSAWIQQELESHIKGEEVIDTQCIVGPRHVLIYDTTLRGTSLLFSPRAPRLMCRSLSFNLHYTYAYTLVTF